MREDKTIIPNSQYDTYMSHIINFEKITSVEEFGGSTIDRIPGIWRRHIGEYYLSSERYHPDTQRSQNDNKN